MFNNDEPVKVQLVPYIKPIQGKVMTERYIDWEDGMPVLRYRNIVKKEALVELTRHAISQPYEGEWSGILQCYIIDPRFEGMTKAEVAEHKLADKAASGSIEATKEIKDRLIGKAKQQIESKNLNISYEDYLVELAKNEGIIPNDTQQSRPLDI